MSNPNLYDPSNIKDGYKPPEPSVDEELRQKLEDLFDRADTAKVCNVSAFANEAMHLLTNRIEAAKLQMSMDIWANYKIEITKRDLSSDVMPKGARKMTDKELLALVISRLQSTNNTKESK